MSLTVEQRREIYRNNARKSTGPKTAEGKAASRRNALKHGMRAEVLALPNEDPEVIAARSDEWYDYYNPQSPAAKQLVNECVRATILSDRVATFHDNILVGQVREATREWDTLHEEHALELNDLFDTSPVEARKHLLRSTHGRYILILRWKSLRETLETQGFWADYEVREAVQLLGSTQNLADLKHNPAAYTACLYNNMAHVPRKDFEVSTLLKSANVPDALQRRHENDPFPDAEMALAGLFEIVDAEIADHMEAKAEIAETYDIPDRSEAECRAMIVRDEKIAKLFLRYQAESRNGFHKALGRLLKTLESDAESGSTREDVSPIEAVSKIERVENEKIDVDAGVEKLRNEPNERSVMGRIPMAIFLLFLGIFGRFVSLKDSMKQVVFGDSRVIQSRGTVATRFGTPSPRSQALAVLGGVRSAQPRGTQRGS